MHLGRLEINFGHRVFNLGQPGAKLLGTSFFTCFCIFSRLYRDLLGQLRSIWINLGNLDPSWDHFETTLGQLGTNLGHLGVTLEPPCTSWDDLKPWCRLGVPRMVPEAEAPIEETQVAWPP